jgi:amino acid transporter
MISRRSFTIPPNIAAMGDRSYDRWVVSAIICLADGLVWAELGAAMPHAGGSYNYLKEIYGKNGFGKLVSFLFIFQLSFSAPLSMASGCVGLASYSSYIFPVLNKAYFNFDLDIPLPVLGSIEASLTCTNGTFVAIGTVLLAVFLLYRKVTIISRFSQFLWGGVILTVIWIIVSGVLNFDPRLAFDFPPDAFSFDNAFFLGLGSAMLIALYDYWGYYNVNFFGGEVENPTRNIPRAIICSILAVAGLYIVMNISIPVHCRGMSETAGSDAWNTLYGIYGRLWFMAETVTLLIGLPLSYFYHDGLFKRAACCSPGDYFIVQHIPTQVPYCR